MSEDVGVTLLGRLVSSFGLNARGGISLEEDNVIGKDGIMWWPQCRLLGFPLAMDSSRFAHVRATSP